MIALWLLAACTVDEEPPPPSKAEAEAAMAEVMAPKPAAVVAPEGGGAPREIVPIEITWKGIGPLYKSFFSTSEPLTELSYALQPHLEGPVQLEIRYDSQEFIGAIHVNVPPGGLKTEVSATAGLIDLQALAPITHALAKYRDDVSGRYDVRIQSFGVGLDFYRGPTHCMVGIAGTHPPDGRMVSPCVALNGEEACGRPGGQGVAYNAEAYKKLSTCLGG